jgi:hypothetical protein
MPAAKTAMVGHAPTATVGPIKKKPETKKISGASVAKLLGITDEQQKYQKVWNVEDYRRVSPGENHIGRFLEALEETDPKYKGKTLIDFGCGSGRAAQKLDEYFDVTPMDFAHNALDPEVAEHFGDRFVQHDITKKTALRCDWAFNTDVMEHLPPEQIDDALATILESADNCYFQIATIPDHFGDHPDIQEQLHLSVHDYDWWLKKFSEHGVVVHRSFEEKHYVVFMVSGYLGFSYDRMKMNTDVEVVYSQIRENYGKGLKQLKPGDEQADQKVVVLCGGPSLNDHIDEIQEHKKNGAKIITMNGTYAWANEHDLFPVTQFMIDARPFNARFVDPVDDRNLYCMASQVSPELIDKLPKDRTFLFHANLDEGSIAIANELVGKLYEDWFPATGGSTVALRTLPVLKMLGFRDIEVYGFDSCWMGEGVTPEGDMKHHAYEQKENDVSSDVVAMATVEGRKFMLEPWMLTQAHEYMTIKARILQGMKIKIHGDGLIAWCIETGIDQIDELKE